jgi:hypothetical protein
MKHSHNDYWNKYCIDTAYVNNCEIIEIDVIYLRGELYMSHSWRPFGFLAYGKLEKAFEKIVRYNIAENIRKNIYGEGLNLYLYLEIKTSNWRAIQLLNKLIKKYRSLNILINGIDKWYSTERRRNALFVFFCNDNVQRYDFFKAQNNIERVELYKNSRYN